VGRLDRRRQLTQGTSGRIVDLLRRGPLTIDQLASAVSLTRTAVRAQLATLLQEGAVEQRGLQRGTSKPARTYAVTAEAELLLSRAYIPILTQLLHVLAGRIPRPEFDAIMRDVGRGLMTGRPMPKGTLKQRVQAASFLLNDLGGVTEVDEQDALFVIHAHGCPLAAATAEYPEACNALESLLSEFVGEPATKCCDRYKRRQCCFEVAKTKPPQRPQKAATKSRS
jgi:predicted ArsR family transcriptional regulator